MSSVCVEIVVQTNCTAQWVVIQHAVKNLSQHPALTTTCQIYSSWLGPAARWLPLENVDLVSTVCDDDDDYVDDDDDDYNYDDDWYEFPLSLREVLRLQGHVTVLEKKSHTVVSVMPC